MPWILFLCGSYHLIKLGPDHSLSFSSTDLKAGLFITNKPIIPNYNSFPTFFHIQRIMKNRPQYLPAFFAFCYSEGRLVRPGLFACNCLERFYRDADIYNIPVIGVVAVAVVVQLVGASVAGLVATFGKPRAHGVPGFFEFSFL